MTLLKEEASATADGRRVQADDERKKACQADAKGEQPSKIKTEQNRAVVQLVGRAGKEVRISSIWKGDPRSRS